MPMHQTIAIFAAAALIAALLAMRLPGLRRRLRRPAIWAGIGVGAALLSGVSGLAQTTGHAGTGFVTRHGWPKPFFFRFTAEDGARSAGFEPLYFAGNALVYGAALLLLLALLGLLRPRP